MEAKSIIVIGLLLVLTVSYSEAKPKPDHYGAHEHKQKGWKMCLNQSIETEKIQSANLTCQAELESVLNLGTNPTHKQLKKAYKNQCFRACVLGKLGLVSNNAFETSAVSTFVDATFPESVRQTIKDQMTACSSTVGSTGLSTTEEKCKSYKPLTKCLDKAIKKNCKGIGMNMPETLVTFTPTSMPAVSMLTSTTAAPQRRRRETSMEDEMNGSSSEESEENDDDEDEDNDHVQ